MSMIEHINDRISCLIDRDLKVAGIRMKAHSIGKIQRCMMLEGRIQAMIVELRRLRELCK